jgi:hypothetical protein
MFMFSVLGPMHYNPELRMSGKLGKGGAQT